MSDTDLYSTIASIVGVWLSVVGALSLALFTHIITQNIHYFTLLRDEKGKLFSSVTDTDITFARTFSDNNEAYKNCSNNLCLIRVICKQSKDEIKQSEDEIRDNVSKTVSKIFEVIKMTIYSYPDPDKLMIFLKAEELLTIDDGYKPWLNDYKRRIDYGLMEKTFASLDTYLNTVEQNKLANDGTQSEISKIKNVMNKLRIINSSIYKIDMLKRDYEPIDTILKTTKNKLTLVYTSGTLFFGVLLPVYMLLPTQLHINKIPEWVVIIGIFAGLFICGCGTYQIMNKIFNSLIKK